MHKAAKSYMDGQGRMINAGDTMPSDYDDQTLAHYKLLGIVGEAAEKPGKKAKSAAPDETKTTEQGAE